MLNVCGEFGPCNHAVCFSIIILNALSTMFSMIHTSCLSLPV